MSELTIKYWVDQEHGSFENFTPVLASRFEEAILRSILRNLRKQLEKSSTAELVLPWGTYRAETKTMGEAANRAASWEPSKGFDKLLNGGNMDTVQKLEAITQDEFDPAFTKDFREFISYGMFDTDKPENKEKLAGMKKGIRLSDEEVVYFLNSYAMVLATIGKDKQREGKIFRLEVNNGYPHGSFDFEYEDDSITVKWTPDKVFKQMLKDDDAAVKGEGADFTPIREVRKETITK